MSLEICITASFPVGERVCRAITSITFVLVQQSMRLELCVQISYWLFVSSHCALHFPWYSFLSVSKLSPSYRNINSVESTSAISWKCWGICSCILSSQNKRSNSQLEPRDVELFELSCSCLLFPRDTEHVLTSPLDFLACNTQSWAELWWTELCISSQNIKQLNPTQHSMIPFHISTSASGNKCFKSQADTGTSAWQGDDGNISIVKPQGRFVLMGTWGRKERFPSENISSVWTTSQSLSPLCQEDHRADCPGNDAKAHEK